MFERDGETWMWLADSGASHHMTSVRRDFVSIERSPTGCG
jgi:hypothetical protein